MVALPFSVHYWAQTVNQACSRREAATPRLYNLYYRGGLGFGRHFWQLRQTPRTSRVAVLAWKPCRALARCTTEISFGEIASADPQARQTRNETVCVARPSPQAV